jgi:hypothetical protein
VAELIAGPWYNGRKMKIWKCYDNLPQQTYWYTNDGRIALKDKGG